MTEEEKLEKERIKAELERKRLERKAEEEREFEKERLKRELNERRLKKQAEEEEKKRILEELNERRLLKQKQEEIEKHRFDNLKIFNIRTKEYYKIHGSYHDYYIGVEDAHKLGFVGTKIVLLERYHGNYNKIKCLAKKEKRKENILISLDAIKVQFEAYKLVKEDKKKERKDF